MSFGCVTWRWQLKGACCAAFATERLAKFKVPTRVFIWPDDLPRGATGKIPKRDVRDDILEGKTAGVVELNLTAAKL